MYKKIIAFIAMAALLVSLISFPAAADAMRVVTIGQDLSDEQEAFIINYFGADLNTCQVIYVNNQQEREYVGSWIPLEQIGNITISSAYVQPTNSGGIQVKTANLTYVTGNMIASVLSTAGVKNCNIVAAAPFPVSGTGALTGVMIAYQTAMGQPLDETKRDLAVQEFTVTQQASESIGEAEALQLVNAVKMEVIQSEVTPEDDEQIQQIVNDVITHVENNITNVDNSTTIVNNGLTEEDRQLILDLATEIAKQDYQYDDMKETLERVEDNLSSQTNITINIDNSNEVSADDNSNTDININNDTNLDVNTEQDLNIDNSDSNENDQDSILSNTNDDLIDPNYQSSTRKEDIIAIEEAIQEEETETDVVPGMYDMSNVEEYVAENQDEYSEPAVEEPVYEEPVFEEPVIEDEPYWIEEVTEEPLPYEEYGLPEESTEFVEYPEEGYEEEFPAEEPQEEIPAEKTAVQAAFTPDNSEVTPEYLLRLFVRKADFRPESGTLEVVGSDGEQRFSIDLTDEKQVIEIPMSEEELQEFTWEEGTEIHIFTGENLPEEGWSLYAHAESQDAVLDISAEVGSVDDLLRPEAKSVDEMRVGSYVNVYTQIADEAVVRVGLEGDPQKTELIDNGDGSAQMRLLAEGEAVIIIHEFDANENEIRTEERSLWIYLEEAGE